MSGAPLENGLAIGAHSDDHPDSPATPVDNSTSADIKLDVDFPAPAPARNDPVPMSVDPVRDASTVPQLGTPADPASLPIDPPSGTPPPVAGDLLDDVKVSEQPAGRDDPMADPPPATQTNGASSPAASSVAASSSYTTLPANDHDDKPPPAKRARKYSDAEKASIANTATPPPASPSPVPAPTTNGGSVHQGPSTFSPAQYRFCTSTVRTLKRLKDAGPFIHPVDAVALNIPHYYDIIKHPMDFMTIERKLQSSNPAKPDPNPANPRYRNADEFVADVRLIFSNCLTFNGPEHPITAMGKRVEAVFDKQIKQMPPPEEVKSPVVKKPSPPPPPPPAPPKKSARRPSQTMPTIRRNETETVANNRPKREIHPPPPKDLPYEAPKKARRAKAARNDLHAEQLKFCEKILKDLHKKVHYNIAHPFYEPVDWVKLDIPTYPKLIKRPMDLSTIRKKLDSGEYPTAREFYDDFKLMIRNCLTFNPDGTPVNAAGRELDRLFEDKWKNMPPLRGDDSDEDDEMEEEEDEQARLIADMEHQIENMNRQLEGLKKGKDKKVKKEKREKVPVPSTSKAPPKPAKSAPAPSTSRKKSNNKRPVTDDDVLSFEQKKDLSDTIAKLDGAKLERVIQIIHEGVPEIRDSTEEIELEIDQLPAAVLTKLYNFVIRPMKPPPAKRARTGKGTGTGGLKRKSMDEDVEAEKIRVLEERMALFESGAKPTARGANHRPAAPAASDGSSDSSSDGESSGSESE
ncbi:Bromodomain-containing protein [Panus rudis PR-1116 ss-1]|nr:Bromodomain-containing protein [Panus rudis PR-1116 ss-1]